MSGVDEKVLDEAVEVALATFLGAERWADQEAECDKVEWRKDMRRALDAAAPVILAAERERIREAVEDLGGEWKPGHICSESEMGMWNRALDRVAAALTEDEL